MSCLDAKISLVPKHQLIVPSTLLPPATNIQTYKATKMHKLTPLTYELFFQNSSKMVYKEMGIGLTEKKKTTTILDKNVKKNARYMFNFRILPSKARFTQDTPPSPPKKQCWSVARTFLLPTKQHWPGRGGGRGHHGAKYAGWVSCV